MTCPQGNHPNSHHLIVSASPLSQMKEKDPSLLRMRHIPINSNNLSMNAKINELPSVYVFVLLSIKSPDLIDTALPPSASLHLEFELLPMKMARIELYCVLGS